MVKLVIGLHIPSHGKKIKPSREGKMDHNKDATMRCMALINQQLKTRSILKCLQLSIYAMNITVKTTQSD